mmetsp:Transcript_36011/g.70863  ORF Transcript_36011/g.70863 Transcript_36011/m.70863 type:complete len:110 (+) Transcript_36011:39-368(+)
MIIHEMIPYALSSYVSITADGTAAAAQAHVAADALLEDGAVVALDHGGGIAGVTAYGAAAAVSPCSSAAPYASVVGGQRDAARKRSVAAFTGSVATGTASHLSAASWDR